MDHTRIKLGEGATAFEQAKAALCRWDQFRLGWVEAYSPGAAIQPGNPVAVIARMGGFWWLNACRVVYVIDEPGPIRRFGFAYGTLPDHAATGEERFFVEWNPADDVVWYDILAFSRPRRFWRGWASIYASHSKAIRTGVGGGDGTGGTGGARREWGFLGNRLKRSDTPRPPSTRLTRQFKLSCAAATVVTLEVNCATRCWSYCRRAKGALHGRVRLLPRARGSSASGWLAESG